MDSKLFCKWMNKRLQAIIHRVHIVEATTHSKYGWLNAKIDSVCLE